MRPSEDKCMHAVNHFNYISSRHKIALNIN